MTDEVRERPLAGGPDQAGAVVRVGETVRRPGGVNAEQVRLFLAHLERSRFWGAPRFLGTDDRGREILDYLEGEVTILPFPDWVAAEELLISVACLQLRLHDAAAGFLLPEGMTWTPRRLPPGAEGSLVCHTELSPENVVTRDGQAVGFIDFDRALPVDPLFDIAVAARHWIPLRDPVDIADARATADLPRRFRCFTAVHGLDADRRGRVVGLLLGHLDTALADIREGAEAGPPGYAAAWANSCEAMNRRSHVWLTAHRGELC